jgi:hypothetical protein
MEPENKTTTAEPAAKRGYSYRAIAGWVALLIACFTVPAIVATQDSKPQQAVDGSVRASMRNVNYRFAENVAVQINNLSGAFVPINGHEMPVFDDKESFKIRIDSAEIAISLHDLANLLNQFVFARPGSPLSGLSVTTAANGHLKVKGRLKDKGDIPFETEGALVPTPDGQVRLHAEKVKALKIPVKGLMDAFGIEVDNLIKSGKVPGLATDGNDLIFDLEQLLPAPHIEGKVATVRVEPTKITETFVSDAKSETSAKAQPKFSGNYIAFIGNRGQFGKVTMQDCDVVLLDMDPSDPLDFFLDRYKDQLAAGYTKISTNFQVRVYVKDFAKLPANKVTAAPKAKN